MISVYDIGNEAFGKNGSAVLHPTSCTVTEDAGGSYELALSHPISVGGEWTHLANGAIIKAPVPAARIENAYVGMDVDIYATTGSTPLRSAPSEPTVINYQQWVSGNSYAVGTKVTDLNKNYKLNALLVGNEIYASPAVLSAKWGQIARYTSGAPTLVTLSTGTEVYFVEDVGSGWYKVSTKYGITGYAKSSQLTFVRHETVQPVDPREIEEQLFRIYRVNINTERKTCDVNARHVSYDLSGIIIKDCDISLAEPAMAIFRIQDAFMIPYRGEIATNMTGSENGTYTGNLSGRNGTFAFLDPDKGIIPYFRGKLIRDNWDLFLMKNDLTDRGIRIAYGVNMRGVTWKRDSGNMINRVVPVARAADGSDLYLPEDWVDSPDIENWPVVRMERMKVDGQVGKDKGLGDSSVWTEADLLDEMRAKAAERFSVDHADAVTVELDVNFTLLGDTEEYREYRGLQKLFLYDVVQVIDPAVGLNLQLQISQMVWDCILRRFVSMKIGNVFDYGGRTVSGYNLGDGAIEYEKISLETIRRIQDEAQ